MHTFSSSLPAPAAVAEHSLHCMICGREMRADLEPDLWLCPECNYRCSAFVDSPGSAAAALDETNRQHALGAIRRRNAQTILRVLGDFTSLTGARLCDIGCGYGWFLAEAERLGVQALGIEPDAAVAEQAIASGLNVRVGSFPECLAARRAVRPVDAERRAGAPAADRSRCSRRAMRILEPGGLLAIAVPTSDGTLFRAGCRLRRIGNPRPARPPVAARLSFGRTGTISMPAIWSDC